MYLSSMKEYRASAPASHFCVIAKIALPSAYLVKPLRKRYEREILSPLLSLAAMAPSRFSTLLSYTSYAAFELAENRAEGLKITSAFTSENGLFLKGSILSSPFASRRLYF